MASTINASSTGGGGLITTGDASGQLALQANGTTVATVSSTGLALATNQTINTANTYGFKNRLMNGGQVIDQRNAGVAVTVNTVSIFSTDRWANTARPTGGGVYSAQQVSDAPTGYSNSLKFTVTTADTSLAASDYYFSWQKIEGFNTADLLFGTASAKTVTLSFWVKSSITGQFSAFLTNSTESYTQPSAYTVNAANTWEFKTLTFTGATAGTWIGATNDTGLIVGFGLANGTSMIGPSGAWAAAGYYGSTGDVNWMATLSNTFQYTGVQLEVGSQATSFDFRSITQEYSLCQRYYYQTTPGAYSQVGQTYSQNSVDGFYVPYPFPSIMRAAPSATISGGTNGGSPASISIYASNPTNVVVNLRSTGATTSVFWVGATLFATAEL